MQTLINYNFCHKLQYLFRRTSIQFIIKSKMPIILEIFLLLFTALQRINAEELIREGDFQGQSLLNTFSHLQYPHNYTTKIYPDSTSSWYRMPDRYVNEYQIRDLSINGQLNLGLDPAFGSLDPTCQDVFPNTNKSYSLSFNYVVDRNVQQITLLVHWSETLIFNETTTSQIPLYFTYDILQLSEIETICFSSSQRGGLMVDNISIASRQIEEIIQFRVDMIDGSQKSIALISNYSVDPTKLSVFSDTIISFNITEVIENISVDSNDTLTFLVTLQNSIYQYDCISIAMPNQTYINQHGQQVYFQVINPLLNFTLGQNNHTTNQTTSQVQTPHNSSQNSQTLTKDEQKSGNEAELENFEDIFFYLYISLQSLRIIGVTALLFKFLSFTNIMILYIFIDVPYLSVAARTSLEVFAKLLFDQSIISILYNLLQGQNIDFFDQMIETGFNYKQKELGTAGWQGSSLASVSIGYNYTYSIFQDSIIVMLNILKIFIIYKFLQSKKESNQDMKQLYECYRKDRKNSILVQFIGLAPPYTAAAGYVLGAHSLKGQFNFYQKMYELHFHIILFVFLTFGVLYQINKFPGKKAQISKITRILRKLDISENYHYILIGFLAGLGYTKLFLIITSVYYISYMIVLAWNWKTKSDFVLIMIRKLAEITVHCGFCFLYVTGNLMDSQEIAQNHSQMLSSIIIYAYLFGCAFQLIVILINIVLSFKKGLLMIVRNCCLNENNRVKPMSEFQSQPMPSNTDKPLPHNTNKPLPNNTDKSLPHNANKPLPNNTDKSLPYNANKLLSNNTNKPLFSNTIKPVPSNTNKPLSSNKIKALPQNNENYWNQSKIKSIHKIKNKSQFNNENHLQVEYQEKAQGQKKQSKLQPETELSDLVQESQIIKRQPSQINHSPQEKAMDKYTIQNPKKKKKDPSASKANFPENIFEKYKNITIKPFRDKKQKD